MRAPLLLCILITAATTAAATAADRRVVVSNKTSYVMSTFQASNVGATDWEEDILGQDVLQPGQSVNVNIDDATGACRFDFLATFEDDRQAEKRDVNVCEISQFDFTD